MDFYLIPQPAAACPVRYEGLAREVRRHDGRILSQAEAGKLCRHLQEVATKATDDINTRRKRLYRKFTDEHPAVSCPRVELRPREGRLDLIVECYVMAELRLVNGQGLLTD